MAAGFSWRGGLGGGGAFLAMGVERFLRCGVGGLWSLEAFACIRSSRIIGHTYMATPCQRHLGSYYDQTNRSLKCSQTIHNRQACIQLHCISMSNAPSPQALNCINLESALSYSPGRA